MKKFLFIIAFIAWTAGGFAQDYLLFKNGEKIAVTLFTVTDEYVRYRLFDDPEGKMYAKDIRLISKIIFQDGRVRTYLEPEVRENRDAEKRDTVPEKPSQAPTEKPTPKEPAKQEGDFLFLKDGRTHPVIVLEITPDIVKYKNLANPTSPVYSIYRSDVIKIIFQNGTIETFTETGNREIDTKPFPVQDRYYQPETFQKPNPNRIRFGIKGGVNFSTYSGMTETFNLINESRDVEMKNENKTGFHTGFICQVNVSSSGFFIQPELLISLQGGKRREGENSFTNDLYYLQLPIPLIYNIKIAPRAGVILGTGPYLAYGVYGSGNAFDEGIEQLDYGFTFLGGFQFGKFQLSGSYDLGMYEIINAKSWEATQGIDGIPALYTRNLKIALGYFF